MQIKNVFQLEIKRRIPAVAKVDDITPETIQQEVSEYVVTSPIEEALVRLLEIYGDSRVKPTDQIGVWISGFFGSGKSHFAKMLNYLLKNPLIDGKPVVDLFKARLDPHNASTNIINGGLLQAQQIDNHVVMFNIEANRHNTSILSTLYSQYLTQERKLSGSIAVGRLELSLIRRGLYEAFKKKVQKEVGEAWEIIREDFSMFRGVAVNALAAVAPEIYPTSQAADKAIDDLIAQENAVSISDVAKELVAYVEELRAAGNPERPPHLIFIIDEIGQFVGREKGRLLELQTIAEEFSTNGRGKLWLIVTSQQDLKGMIADIGSVQDEFGRIITRFDTRLALTAQDVELVLENRILKKNEQGKSELAQLFTKYGGELGILGKLPGSSRELPALNKDSFPASYPFLPYQLALIQDMIKAARTVGGTGFTLNTEARSMLGLCQGIITKNLLDGSVGRLVSLDLVFNQVRLDLNQADVREIDKVPTQVSGKAGFDARVVKALYFLQQVSYIACTPEVIAHALFQDIQGERITELKKQVEEGLKRLDDAGFVIQKEAGVYEFLTGSKKSFEEEVNGIDARKNEQRRTVRTRLTEVLREVGQVDYDKKRKFDTTVIADGERLSEGDALVLQVYSPLHIKLEDGLTVESIEMDSFTHTDTVYWLSKPDDELERLVVRMFKLSEALKPRQAQQSKTDEDKDLIREKSKEISTLQQTIETRLRSALYNGSMIWNGDVQELDGKTTTLNLLFNKAMSRVVPHIYPKFDLAAIRPDAKTIETVLTINDFALRTVEPGLQLFDDKNHLNTHAPAIDEIMRELERRDNKGLDKDGKSLLAHFEGTPYGWHPEVIRLLMAAMFRGGAISIKSGNVTYDDASVPAARDRLTKANDFKSAVFLYDPDEAVSLTERKTAQDALYVMFGRSKTQDTASALAEYVLEDLKKLNEQVERLGLQLVQAEYPLPAPFKHSRDLIQKVSTHIRPNKVLRLFLEHVDEIKTLHADAALLYSFVEKDKHIPRYKQTRALLVAYAATQNVYAAMALHRSDVVALAAALRDGAAKGPAGEAWMTFDATYLALLAQFQAAYEDLHRQRDELYSRLSAELAAENIEIQHFQTYHCTSLAFDPLKVACKTCEHSLALLAEQLMAMPTAAKTLRESKRQPKPGDDGPTRKVTRISVSSLLAGREITNAGELQDALKVIEKKATDALNSADAIELI